MHLFIALKQLALFKLHKEWKAFRTWKRAINTVKINAAKAALVKNLFLLSPVFQGPLQQFHELCHELSHLRLHSLKQGEVSKLCNLMQTSANEHNLQHWHCLVDATEVIQATVCLVVCSTVLHVC